MANDCFGSSETYHPRRLTAKTKTWARGESKSRTRRHSDKDDLRGRTPVRTSETDQLDRSDESVSSQENARYNTAAHEYRGERHQSYSRRAAESSQYESTAARRYRPTDYQPSSLDNEYDEHGAVRQSGHGDQYARPSSDGSYDRSRRDRTRHHHRQKRSNQRSTSQDGTLQKHLDTTDRGLALGALGTLQDATSRRRTDSSKAPSPEAFLVANLARVRWRQRRVRSLEV